MQPDEIKRKIDELQRRHQTVVQKKASLSGQLEAKKQELAKIVQEVRQAGYDPKNLASERDKAQKDLLKIIDEFEGDLAKVEAALAEFNDKK